MLSTVLGSKIIRRPKTSISTPSKTAGAPLTLSVDGCSSTPINKLFLYTAIIPTIDKHKPRNRHAKAVSRKDNPAKIIRIKVTAFI
jgi:hypothetical protein